MVHGNDIPLKTGKAIVQDTEIELVDQLCLAIERAGLRVERMNIINTYVALKHRPMAILIGPAGRGKCTFLHFLASTLIGRNALQKQIMPGHAWYASGNPANITLINMHSRLITEKLFCIIEEALQPENARQVYIVGLTEISPAELLCFFTELAEQVQHREIMRIGDAHLSAPIPFPRNLLLIGTMNEREFDYSNRDLLSGATIIDWHASAVTSQGMSATDSGNFGTVYLRSSIRDSGQAYEKLVTVTASIKQPLQPVMLVRSIFELHGLGFSTNVLDEVILYLANAWSAQGIGLFNPSTSRNLEIAVDLALAQLVLPHYLETIKTSRILQDNLYTVLDKQLPRCHAFLKRYSSENYLLTSKGIGNNL